MQLCISKQTTLRGSQLDCPTHRRFFGLNRIRPEPENGALEKARQLASSRGPRAVFPSEKRVKPVREHSPEFGAARENSE